MAKHFTRLLFLLIPGLLFGAGSVQQTTTQLGNTNTWVTAFSWTGDASTGAVPVTSAVIPSGCNCQGYLFTQVEVVPGSPSPTSGYSLQILDAGGADILNGAAASLSATTPQAFAAAGSATPLQGSFRLSITGQSVASAKGTVYVFFSKPGTINLATIGSGGGGGNTANWLTIANPPFVDARRFNFPPQSPGGSLSAGTCSFLMSPLPAGVAVGGGLYISGTGTPEAITITSITGSTVTATCANSHAAGYSVSSSTVGWQEAAQVAGANGSVYFTAGTYTLHGPLMPPYNGQTYFADDANQVTFTVPNSSNIQRLVITGATSDLTFLRLGFDGNFVNQTYASGTNDAIDGTNSIRLNIFWCKFMHFGDTAGTSNPQVVSMYTANDCQIRNNLFLSNFANEIILNGANGCAVTDNTFGSPNLTDSKTNINWWDTYSGGFGVDVEGGGDFYFAGNRMYGAQRQVVGGTITIFSKLIGLSAGGSVQTIHIQVHNNLFEGLGGSGRGTLSVTNGSGSIVGSNTLFVSTGAGDSFDVGRQLMLEGDNTIYKITAYTSATSITVSPVIARSSASNLRYAFADAGDAIVMGNVPNGAEVTGNAVNYSGGNGYDVAASPAAFSTAHVIFANNKASHSLFDGLFLGGNLFNSMFTGNLFLDNGLLSLAGHAACIEMSPTNQGSEAAQPMWHNTFTGNQCVDDQTTATQLTFFQITSGQNSHIFSNTLSGNHFFVYNGGTPTGSFFDASTTSTMQGEMFNWAGVSDSLQFTPVAFTDLGNVASGTTGTAGPVNGMLVYCYDCTVASTCAGSGTGAFAKRLNGAWVCN